MNNFPVDQLEVVIARVLLLIQLITIFPLICYIWRSQILILFRTTFQFTASWRKISLLLMEYRCTEDDWSFPAICGKAYWNVYILLTSARPRWMTEPNIRYIGLELPQILRMWGEPVYNATGMHQPSQWCHQCHLPVQIFPTKWLWLTTFQSKEIAWKSSEKEQVILPEPRQGSVDENQIQP